MKSILRALCPPFVLQWRTRYIQRGIWKRKFEGRSAREVFAEIHQTNYWGSGESVSGVGSELEATRRVRELLEGLVDRLKLSELLDVPCGDFNWMREVNLKGCRYTGGDIVADIVEKNQQRYGSDRRRFIQVDLLADTLPKADLILCRDCLFHLSHADVARAVQTMVASGSTHLLTTTFSEVVRNVDVVTGGFRPINLQLPPFNFPPPVELLRERPDANPADQDFGKGLGLWALSSLKA